MEGHMKLKPDLARLVQDFESQQQSIYLQNRGKMLLFWGKSISASESAPVQPPDVLQTAAVNINVASTHPAVPSNLSSEKACTEFFSSIRLGLERV